MSAAGPLPRRSRPLGGPTRSVLGAMSETVVIELERVACSVGAHPVLDLQRLRIEAGERVAVVGPNGAGKTTLLRLLSGFVRPERGSLRVLGRDLGTVPRRRALRELRGEIGQVMQGLHLVQRLTVIENVAIGALGRLRGWRGWLRCYEPRDVADAEAALASVGLLHKAHERADRLSGGERQKVAIARMLMQRPRLILADEPTASLDPQASSELCALLGRAAGHATLLSVVHNRALLPLLADRVVGIRQGRIVLDLPIAAVGDAVLTDLYRAEAPAASRWREFEAVWRERLQP